MNTSIKALLLISVIALNLLGCVAQSEADRWQALYRKTQAQVEDLRAELRESNARIAAMEDSRTVDPETLELLEQTIAQRDRLAKALEEAEMQLRSLGGATSPLPPELNQALIELAAANPELMSYDPVQGMIKFRSDFTFASGSAQVQQQAAATLAKLAQIVKAPVAQAYEVRVVGHTDNVPISRPATKAQHPTNWHLSVHRAISVKDELTRAGVAQDRMMVAGYGEYRPVVPNKVTGGKARGAEANRRVEIFLMPSTARGGQNATGTQAEPESSSAPAATPAADEPETMEMFK